MPSRDAPSDAQEPARGHDDVRDAAEATSRAAAARAGVVVREIDDMPGLRTASRLFETVWGTSPEGVPMHSEVLREIAHAGGCVTGAFEDDGALVGAAVLGPARPAGTVYGYLAAALPGRTDGGVGRALKLRQRAWALARDLTTMTWTFDPLVARNARFNLTRLGATAPAYEVAFFGRMRDDVNGADESDRFVAHWRLDSARVASRLAEPPHEPGPDDQPAPGADARRLADAPDGGALALRDARGLWCRIPRDVVALRRTDPAAASAWRRATREVLAGAMGRGLAATHLTREGWYLLEES